MTRVVIDLGNTRIKWGRLDDDGNLAEAVALPLDAPETWAATLDRWQTPAEPTAVAWSSVNPPIAEGLDAFLKSRGVRSVRRFRSAADVLIAHDLHSPQSTGADRALAVLAATAIQGTERPGLVVLCGTAITVECVAIGGIWQGGAILPGLGLATAALHQRTAQLPHIVIEGEPLAWGRSTEPAIAAGVFWGTVGAMEGILIRQARDLLGGPPWIVGTGGDASALLPKLERVPTPPRILPDLVLQGLAKSLDLKRKAPVVTTRVAVLTADGRGAIAVVRLWGPDAVAIADRAFRPARGRRLADGHLDRPRFGRLGAGLGDEVVAVLLGTDPPEAEIQCHGGPAMGNDPRRRGCLIL